MLNCVQMYGFGEGRWRSTACVTGAMSVTTLNLQNSRTAEGEQAISNAVHGLDVRRVLLQEALVGVEVADGVVGSDELEKRADGAEVEVAEGKVIQNELQRLDSHRRGDVGHVRGAVALLLEAEARVFDLRQLVIVGAQSFLAGEQRDVVEDDGENVLVLAHSLVRQKDLDRQQRHKRGLLHHSRAQIRGQSFFLRLIPLTLANAELAQDRALALVSQQRAQNRHAVGHRVSHLRREREYDPESLHGAHRHDTVEGPQHAGRKDVRLKVTKRLHSHANGGFLRVARRDREEILDMLLDCRSIIPAQNHEEHLGGSVICLIERDSTIANGGERQRLL